MKANENNHTFNFDHISGIEIDIIYALALILGTFYQQFMNNKATYVLSLVLQIGRPNFSELLKIN